MRNVINFMKFHTVEFSKFASFVVGVVFLGVVVPFTLGALTFEYLFPIMGMWVWPISGLVMLVLGYMTLVVVDIRTRKSKA